MASEKRGQAIQVVVDTKITQGDQSENHHFEEPGQLMKLNGTTYIRFIEHNGTKNVPVTFKIDNGNRVRLTRKNESQLTLLFENGKQTDNRYITPYGKLNIGVKTDKVVTKIDEESSAGKLNIDYQIINFGEKVGNYQIKLQFNL